MQLSFTDRLYLVPGGGSGIGKGVAAALVAAVGNVLIIGRNAEKLAAAADEIKAQAGEGAGSVAYLPADVTAEDDVAGWRRARALRKHAVARQKRPEEIDEVEATTTPLRKAAR